MTAAYKTVSAATFGTEIIAAPSAKNRRVVRSLYINSSTQLKVALISGYVNEIQSVYHGATGGTFTLTYAGDTTATIAWNANAALIVTRLEAIASITDVTVTGDGTSGDPWIVTFVDPGGADIDLMTLDPASLTGAVTTIATDSEGTTSVDEVQTLSNDATSGTFTILFDAQETSALGNNASAGQIASALEGLSNIVDVTVTGVGSPTTPWNITFNDPTGAISEITTDDTNLVGGSGVSTVITVTPGVDSIDEVQSVYNNAFAGTFTLTYSAQTTSALAFDISAGDLDTALQALSNVADVTVTGTGTSIDPWIVTFVDPTGDIDEMTATDTGLIEVNIVGEQTPGAGTEKFAVYLAADGHVDLAYNPSDEGWFECGSAESLNFTTSASGEVTILLGYDTVGGS